jgi:hypothetical protein
VSSHTVNTNYKTMRTKALLSVAAIAASAITAVAQSNVYSLNIVGYATVTIPSGYSLMANPLSAGVTNGANEIMPIIDGEVILTWNNATSKFVQTGFDSGFGGWIDANNNPSVPPSLAPGQGFFFLNPVGPTNVTFVGQVVPNPGTTNHITLPSGYSLIGSAIPATVPAITNAPVSLPVLDGMAILSWNNATTKYVQTGFDSGFGGWIDANSNPSTAPGYTIGEGFFFLNPVAATTWDQSLQ